MQTGESQLRVGVVGMGWAGQTHLKAYLQIPNVQVVAIADMRSDHLASLGETYGIRDLYADYEDLLARDDIDVISVCTPNYLHAPITVAALNNGKHVLCEKPLARSLAAGETMVKTAIENNRVLQVAFNHRKRHDVQVLKAQIDDGEMGRVYHGKATWMRRKGIPGMGGWFTNKEQAGGGPLIDLGVHVLDMALYLLGEPEVLAVSAATYAELGPRGRGGRNDNKPVAEVRPYDVEDLATAFIRLSDGVTLLLEASWAVYGRAGDDFGVTLYGTEGGADIEIKNYSWQDTLRIYTDLDGAPSIIAPQLTKGEGHLGVVRDFVDAILSGDWASHNGEEGLRRTQIIEACYKSALEGREIQLTDVAERL